jgi:predicted RNA-binding Zn ribbon-like protein
MAPQLDPKAFPRRKRLGVEAALGVIAADAVRVISDSGALLRRCDLDSCGALFLDPGTGRPRKWCSMARCGNRANVRLFRSRAARR